MIHFGVVCLLPDMFRCLDLGVTGRAIAQGLVKLDLWNPRDWGLKSYKQVDDSPYGGGPGMVMRYEPLHAAIKQAKNKMPASCKTIYLSPQGRLMKQRDLTNIVQQKQSLLFIAGRYEGIDERVILHDVDEEWSLGDFVLSGGELAAMVFIDALTRLIPGSLGHLGSAQQDSFMNGLLDYPHYTRPFSVDGLFVPAVLTSGDHEAIARWRRKQSLGKTWLKRPELLEQIELSEIDKQLLAEFKSEQG
jgi:tRNA (guanine37-N1)-methyltransferase